jgi:hypothetical protein
MRKTKKEDYLMDCVHAFVEGKCYVHTQKLAGPFFQSYPGGATCIGLSIYSEPSEYYYT